MQNQRSAKVRLGAGGFQCGPSRRTVALPVGRVGVHAGAVRVRAIAGVQRGALA